MASNLPINLVVEFNDIDNVQNYNEKFYLARNGLFKQTLTIDNTQGFVNVDITNLAPGVEKVMIVPVDKFYPQSKVTVRFNIDTGMTTYDMDLPTKKILLWTIHQDFVTDLAGLQIATESITPMQVYVYFFSTAVDPDTQQEDGEPGVGIVTSVNGRDGDVVLTSNDVGLANVNNTADMAKPVSIAQQNALALKQSISGKGLANGYASLDGTGKIPLSQIPPTAGAVWGTISGTLSTQTDLQNALNARRSQAQNHVIVQKTPGALEFSSIATAVASISGATASNRFEILVAPGIYTEPAIVLPDYVSLRGADIQSVIIEPAAATHHVVQLGLESEISFVTIRNAGPTYAAVYIPNVGDYAQLHKISIEDSDTGIFVTSSSNDTYAYLEYVDIGGVFTNALKATSTGSALTYVNAENFYTFDEPAFSGDTVLADGSNVELNILSSGFFGVNTATGVQISNGAKFSAQGVYFKDFLKAIFVENSGSNPVLSLNATDFRDCLQDIDVANPTASGHLVGYSSYGKTDIVAGSTFFIAEKDPQIVTVSLTGGDFTSVSAAVAAITDASVMKPYVVSIGPGIFVEPEITMKPYVHLKGSGNMLTVLMAASPTQKIIRGIDASSVDSVLVTGANGVGGVGIYYEGNGTSIFEIMHTQFGNNTTQCQAFGNTAKTVVVLDSSGAGEFTFTNGFNISSNPGIPTEFIIMDFIWKTSVGPYPTGNFATVSGPDTIFRASNLTGIVTTPTGNGIVASNGAQVYLSASNLGGFLKGIWSQNTGTGPLIRANGVSVEDSTQDIQIDHPDTTGSFQGVATSAKIYIEPTATYPLAYQDPATGDIVASGLLKLGFAGNTQEDVSTLIVESSTMGVLSGGALSDGGGFLVNVASGVGYVDSAGILKKHTWGATSITLSANVTRYIFFNYSGVISSSASLPVSESNIILGRVATNATGIELIERSKMDAHHTPNIYDESFRKAFGPIYASGSAVSEHTTPFQLNVTSGTYYFATNRFTPSGGSVISFNQYYQDGFGGWNRNTLTTINHTHYDNSSGTLQTLTAGYYAKHALYLVGDGSTEKYFVVLAQAQYATLLEAQNADLPFSPPWLSDAVVLVASIIIQQGAVAITEIRDERPRAGFKAAGTSSSSDHQSLSNRNDPSAHPQYLLIDGTSTMTGDLNMGTNDLTNVGTINGVTVTELTSRLVPGGPDELPTAAPSANLTAITTNGVGITSIFSRSDHSHAIDTGSPVNIGTVNVTGTGSALARHDHVHAHGSQTDSSHHAIATGVANGFMSAIDKSKLDLVTLIEMGYLSGVTSSIQTQLNNKQGLHANLTALSALATFGMVVQTAASTFATRTVTAASARLSVVNGDGIAGNPVLDVVESNLLLANIGGVLSIAKGGTNSLAPLVNNRFMVSVGGAIVEHSAVTGNRAVASNASGLPVASATTDTELGYLSGVTSAVQTQINGKQPLASQLTTFAAYNTNGLFTQTAAGTYTGRSIAAGSSKLSVTNADGVAGNPTLDVVPGNISISSLSGTLAPAQFDLVHSGSVIGNFGAANQEIQIATTTVPAAWVVAGSRIVANMLYAGTTDHDGDDSLVEELSVHAGNIVPGVSFDLTFFAPNGSWGDYRAHYVAY